MPLVHFPFRLKPVRQVCTLLATALMPPIVRALGNLFFKTHAFVHVQNGRGNFFVSTSYFS
jgi:hypothetical protein